MDTDKVKNNMLGLFIPSKNAGETKTEQKNDVGIEEKKLPSDTVISAPEQTKSMSSEEVFNLSKKLEAERDVFKSEKKSKSEWHEKNEELEIKRKLDRHKIADPDSVREDETDVLEAFFDDEKTNIWVKLSDDDKLYAKKRAKMLFRQGIIDGTTYTDLFSYLIARDREEIRKIEVSKRTIKSEE